MTRQALIALPVRPTVPSREREQGKADWFPGSQKGDAPGGTQQFRLRGRQRLPHPQPGAALLQPGATTPDHKEVTMKTQISQQHPGVVAAQSQATFQKE